MSFIHIIIIRLLFYQLDETKFQELLDTNRVSINLGNVWDWFKAFLCGCVIAFATWKKMKSKLECEKLENMVKQFLNNYARQHSKNHIIFLFFILE